MFGRHALEPTMSYDRNSKTPVIRASICTGEKVAGFRDIATGKFEEVMLIQTDGDLQEFMRLYGVKPEEIKKVW